MLNTQVEKPVDHADLAKQQAAAGMLLDGLDKALLSALKPL